MLIQPAGDIGALASGDTNRFTFNTVTDTNAPIGLIGGAVQVRNLATGALVATGVNLIPDWQSVLGLNWVEIDTSNQTNFPKNVDYQAELTSGTVGTVSVVGRVVAQFSVAGKSSGRMYDQAVKVVSGVVSGVDGSEPDRVFTGQFANASQVSDYYKAQVISFQPKSDGTASANQGVGRSILSSQGAGTGLVTFRCQDPFNSLVQIGDAFKILPEERGLAIYTCNITTEWGGVDVVARDQYTIIWSEDGNVINNPGSIITQMNLQVWRRETGSADTLIINENLTPDASSGAYEWDETTEFIAVNQGAIMKATATIDGIQHTFARTLYNYA